MDMINQQDIITNVATNILEDSIKYAWQKVNRFFSDLDAKDAIRYKTAYETYLVNTRRKNSQIKTIIYRRVPKDLYSFYECIGVRYNGEIINTNNVSNLFLVGNKIIVTGTGGVGKSILFKHLFLNVIEETTYIPVLLELRSFNALETKDISLYESIYKVLCDNGFDLSKEYFEYSLKEGAYVIFLDGYDEVNRDKADKITREIKSLADKYNENNFLISSRPTEEFIGWNDFCEVEALKLSKKQALSLIKKLEFDENVKSIFYKELDEHLYERYESFASNPLLLNIMLLTFQKHAIIPERLNDFYEEAFVTLFNAHDATKDSYVRDIRCGLGCEDFKSVFSYLCFKSYFNGEYEFSEARLIEYLSQAKLKLNRINFMVEDFLEDLTQSVCMLVKEGLVYRFSHRSFQEYFAACYTCKLTDEIQSKLLLNWIKESESVTFDSYFMMLFDLQSEKVNKIIICPIIKELKKYYQTYGFSVAFLKKIFSGLTISKMTVKKNDRYHMGLTIRNHYICRGLMLNNQLNGYHHDEGSQKSQEVIFNKIIEFYKDDADFANKKRYKFGFEEILNIVDEHSLLQSLDWFENQVLFAIQLLEKYEDSNVSRKKKVSSILNEL